jgi:hypothetical protein
MGRAFYEKPAVDKLFSIYPTFLWKSEFFNHAHKSEPLDDILRAVSVSPVLRLSF